MARSTFEQESQLADRFIHKVRLVADKNRLDIKEARLIGGARKGEENTHPFGHPGLSRDVSDKRDCSGESSRGSIKFFKLLQVKTHRVGDPGDVEGR